MCSDVCKTFSKAMPCFIINTSMAFNKFSTSAPITFNDFILCKGNSSTVLLELNLLSVMFLLIYIRRR